MIVKMTITEIIIYSPMVVFVIVGAGYSGWYMGKLTYKAFTFLKTKREQAKLQRQ